MASVDASPAAASQPDRLLDLTLWLEKNTDRGANPASIATYVSEIKAAVERDTGIVIPRTAAFERYLLRLQQYHNKDNERRLPKPTPRDLILAVFNDRALGRGQRLGVLLAFNGLLRSEDYCSDTQSRTASPYTLLRSDIFFDPSSGAYRAKFKKSKSDPALQGKYHQWLPQHGEASCPVKALRDYLGWFDARFAPNTPLLRMDDGRFLTRHLIDSALQKHAPAFGIDPADMSSHCPRFGGAFELFESGVPIQEIITRGRWRGQSAKAMAQHYGNLSVKRAQRTSDALRLSLPAARSFGKRQ